MIWDNENGILRPRRELVKPMRSFLPGHGGVAGNLRSFGLSLKGSIAFNGSDEYLIISSFSSSSPNQRTLTASIWFYQSSITFGKLIEHNPTGDAFSDLRVSGASTAPQVVDVDSGGSFEIAEYEDNSISADTWYHLVAQIDTTDGTAEDRVKLFLDGVEQTPTSETTPAQNYDTSYFTNGEPLSIGASSTPGVYFVGDLADIIMVEGAIIAPTEFGYDNGGTWSWKDYTGSFGAHGFRINPQNSGEIGTDQSGNGYDFTLNNMDSSNFNSGNIPPT